MQNKRLFILITISLFFISNAFGVDNSSGSMRRDSVHVSVVKNTYNSVYDMSSALITDLRTYCTTFFIENDTERAYINAMVPLRRAKESHKVFSENVRKNDLNAIKESEAVFIKDEQKLYDTIKYFTPSVNQGVKDYVVVPREYYESEFMFKDYVPVEYSIYESKTFDERALFDENSIIANIICSETDSDMLVIPSSFLISSTLIRARLKLYNRIEGKFYTIYDSIVEMSSFADLSSSWVLLLATHISARNYALYSFVSREYAMSIEIDGVKSPGSGVVLPGVHKIKLTSPGRKDKEFDYEFEMGKINEIDEEIEMQQGDSLLITTTNGNKAVFTSGKLSFLLPHTLEHYEMPLNYSVSSPGYATENNVLISPSENGELKITLRPEWASRQSFVQGEKVKFYSSFTATLAAFALTIASKSFYSSGKNTAVWSSIDTISTGLIYASLGVMFGTLVDYFISSKYLLY